MLFKRLLLFLSAFLPSLAAHSQCMDSIDVWTQPASCGQPTGYACAFVWSGDPNATFVWSNGQTTNCIQNLLPGAYTVTATDANGTYVCTAFIASSQLDVFDCSYMCDPVPSNNLLEPCVWSGTPPYNYQWSNGMTTPNIMGSMVPYGNYTVTVTDATGCSGMVSINYTQYTPISVNGTVNDATCGSNGSVILSVSGAVGQVLYDWYDSNWNWFGNNQNLLNVGPGTYTVNVHDSSQCSGQSYTFTVGGAGSPQVLASVAQETCLQQNGSIVISLMNFGNSPNVTWSNGMSNVNTISQLGHGWYSVTVADNASSCVAVENFYVDQDYCPMTIEGTVYNASGAGSCIPFLSLGMPYQQLILQPLGLVTFTDAWGNYVFQLPGPGNYTISLANVPANGTLLCPTTNALSVSAPIVDNYYGNDFYITMPPVNDVAISVYNYSTATPGFPLWTNVTYCNVGNQTSSGTFEFVYDPVLTYTGYNYWGWSSSSATLNNHNPATHTLTFSYSGLMAGACEYINVNFATSTSAVLGNPVSYCVNIDGANDVNSANDTDCDTLTVIGSWDPNDKRVFPFREGDEFDGMILETDNQLEYIVRFQNTGTAPAVHVVLRDTLENNLLSSTIEGFMSSHPGNVRIDHNILIVEFPYIYLPDSATDYEGSIGHIHFFINRTPGLPLGTEIRNRVGIYFDYNEPVITNEAISTIGVFSSIVQPEEQMQVRVMPNPFRQMLTVEYALNQASEVQIELYNLLGERVDVLQASAQQAAGSYQLQYASERLTSGVYFLNIRTDKGVHSQRIVKE